MKKSFRFLAKASFLEAEAATAGMRTLFCALFLVLLSLRPLSVVKKSSSLREFEAVGLTHAGIGRNVGAFSANFCYLSQL